MPDINLISRENVIVEITQRSTDLLVAWIKFGAITKATKPLGRVRVRISKSHFKNWCGVKSPNIRQKKLLKLWKRGGYRVWSIRVYCQAGLRVSFLGV